MANEISPKLEEEKNRIYYTADRNYYAQPVDNGATIIVEKEKPTWNWCLCLVVTIFLVLLIIAIIILIVYFIVGFGPKSLSSEYPLREAQIGRTAAFRAPVGHYDLLLADAAVHTLRSEPTCILATGTPDAYNAEHLPGARHTSETNFLVRTQERSRQLAHPMQFSKYMQSLNVSKDCHVLIYHQESKDLGFARAAWLWWVFQTYGHPKVSVINGGLPNWSKLGYPTTADATPSATGDFEGSWNPETYILYEDLKALVDEARTFNGPTDFQIIDTRSPELYNGTVTISPIPGHIRYAINVPSKLFYKENGKIRDFEGPQGIREILFSRGVKENTRTIVYSEIMLESALAYFVLRQTPGYGPVQVYDGGWQEWSSKTPPDELKQ